VKHKVGRQTNKHNLQASVVTYLKCGEIVNNHIKKGLLQSLSVKKIKSVNNCQSYKQKGGRLVRFGRLATTLLKGE